MSAKTLPEIETAMEADDFHALEQKILRAVEMLKAAREAQGAAEREARRWREQVEEQRAEFESMRRENVGLRREREEIRSRVEKMLKQIEALEKS
jgi:chromosome segregation ATPase